MVIIFLHYPHPRPALPGRGDFRAAMHGLESFLLGLRSSLPFEGERQREGAYMALHPNRKQRASGHQLLAPRIDDKIQPFERTRAQQSVGAGIHV